MIKTFTGPMFSGKTIALLSTYLKDIYEHIKKNTRTIFIDEANFLKGDVSVLIDLSINKNIDIYVCGLNMTSEQKPFGIMGDILAVSDYIEIKKSYCTICNREASYTYFEGDKNKDIVVGDSGYISLCEECLRKKRKNEE